MTQRCFILTEAAATLPLVRQILVDVREARARLSRLQRQLDAGLLDEAGRLAVVAEMKAWQCRLDSYQNEWEQLGIEVTPGVRCEAWFPFEHRWTGPGSDGKIRPARFVYCDSQPTIVEWFFNGWPNDRRQICPDWWHEYRAKPDKATSTA